MSALREYLKLIPEGLRHISSFVEGVVNDISVSTLPQDEKEEIIARRVICQQCPYMSENALSSEEYKSVTGQNYSTERTDPHCAFCGCPIKTRTASLSSNCGIISWNKKHPKQKLPLKWTAYPTSHHRHESNKHIREEDD